MTLRDLRTLVSSQKRKQERIILMRKFAVIMSIATAIVIAAGLCATKRGKKMRKDLEENVVNTIEPMKDSVKQESASVKASVVKAKREVQNIIKNVCDKTGEVAKNTSNGFHQVTQDIHKTAENISKELNKSVK